MEYVNGCDLEHLGTEKAKAAFEEHVRVPSSTFALKRR